VREAGGENLGDRPAGAARERGGRLAAWLRVIAKSRPAAFNTEGCGTRLSKDDPPVLEKSVVAFAEELDEFHVAELLQLLANFGLDVGVVRMELRE
jgi:hypothetical protein